MICIVCTEKETKEDDVICEICSHRTQLEQAFILKGYADIEYSDLINIPLEERTQTQEVRIIELEKTLYDLSDVAQALYSIWAQKRAETHPP